MKNKYRILKILVTVIILGFLLNFSLKRFNNANIKQIVVNILQTDAENKVYFIDEKNVKDFVRNMNPSNKIGNIDIPKLEQEVNRFPSVDSGNVYLKLNGELNIDIQQRTPLFRIQKGEHQFYVDTKNEEFPISKIYSHPVMLVTGEIKRSEYPQVSDLINIINNDNFCKKFFVGLTKKQNSYHLLTANGDYTVEIGDLDNLKFKIKGFKTFMEKILIYQPQKKYSKISVRYDNQIVTTLNPYFQNLKEEK